MKAHQCSIFLFVFQSRFAVKYVLKMRFICLKQKILKLVWEENILNYAYFCCPAGKVIFFKNKPYRM